jgi:hypothetical protein
VCRMRGAFEFTFRAMLPRAVFLTERSRLTVFHLYSHRQSYRVEDTSLPPHGTTQTRDQSGARL